MTRADYSNSLSKLSLRLALVIAIAISCLLLSRLFATTTNAWNTTPIQAQNADERDHYLYAAFYSTKEGRSSSLALNNSMNRAVNVRVTLYNKHGQALIVPEISMPPNLNRYFDIADWLSNADDEDDFSEGSVEIFFYGIPMGLGGQLVVTDENHSLNFDVPFAESEMFVSSRVESLWWAMDDKTQAEVFLANTKAERMTITPTFYIGGAAIASEPIVLDSHESEVLNIGQALKKLHVSVNTVRGGLRLAI
jgi:hypothetical protein